MQKQKTKLTNFQREFRKGTEMFRASKIDPHVQAFRNHS